MATYDQMNVGSSEGYNSMEKVQKIIDGLGTVKGIKRILLVSEEGFPILSARTLPISDEVETVVSAMVAGIVSTFSSACIQLSLGDQIDFIHSIRKCQLWLIPSASLPESPQILHCSLLTKSRI